MRAVNILAALIAYTSLNNTAVAKKIPSSKLGN